MEASAKNAQDKDGSTMTRVAGQKRRFRTAVVLYHPCLGFKQIDSSAMIAGTGDCLGAESALQQTEQTYSHTFTNNDHCSVYDDANRDKNAE